MKTKKKNSNNKHFKEEKEICEACGKSLPMSELDLFEARMLCNDCEEYANGGIGR